ncbi:MAG: hypothetical protein H6509_14675, partial [Bryobacterales bacterium]|nr:hypothetical protein [Bryobacterales bacterium]
FQMFADYWKLFLAGIEGKHANAASAAASLLTTELIESLQQARAEG